MSCSVKLLYVTEDERHSASVTFSDTTDSTNSTAAMSGEQHELLSLEELKPFQNPEQALRECTQSLSNPDWCVCVCVAAAKRLLFLRLCVCLLCVFACMCVCLCVCVYVCVPVSVSV